MYLKTETHLKVEKKCVEYSKNANKIKCKPI